MIYIRFYFTFSGLIIKIWVLKISRSNRGEASVSLRSSPPPPHKPARRPSSAAFEPGFAASDASAAFDCCLCSPGGCFIVGVAGRRLRRRWGASAVVDKSATILLAVSSGGRSGNTVSRPPPTVAVGSSTGELAAPGVPHPDLLPQSVVPATGHLSARRRRPGDPLQCTQLYHVFCALATAGGGRRHGFCASARSFLCPSCRVNNNGHLVARTTTGCLKVHTPF